MNAMGLEALDRPTGLALRSLQDLIMLKRKGTSVIPALVYAGELGWPLALGLLGWLLTLTCKLAGRSPAHLAVPVPRGLVSLALPPEERAQRLHCFLLASRMLVHVYREELTGGDLAAAELLADDIAEIVNEFTG
jgi:hypothetical protein